MGRPADPNFLVNAYTKDVRPRMAPKVAWRDACRVLGLRRGAGLARPALRYAPPFTPFNA